MSRYSKLDGETLGQITFWRKLDTDGVGFLEYNMNCYSKYFWNEYRLLICLIMSLACVNKVREEICNR